MLQLIHKTFLDLQK